MHTDSGNERPQVLANVAAAHFYAPEGIVQAVPPEMEAITIGDIERFIALRKTARRPAPESKYSAQSADGFSGQSILWRAGLVTGYVIGWRTATDADRQSVCLAAHTH
jgi:hypothetical protein